MAIVIVTVTSFFGLAGVLITILVCVIKFSKDNKNEKLYTVYIENALSESNFLSQCAPKIPRRIIVDSQQNNFSTLRNWALKLWFRIRKIDVKEEPVLIFGKNSEGQKACLIKLAVENAMLDITALDTNYRDTIINYEAYRYVRVSKYADKPTRLLLKKEWENSPRREHIANLDDHEFSEKVVINPPPELKSLLEIIVYPIVAIKSKNLIDIPDFHAHERESVLTTKIIKCLAEQTMGVLFVGNLQATEYIDMVGNKVFLFKDGFIISGLGNKIGRVEYITHKLCEQSQELWNLKLDCDSTYGIWNFPKGLANFIMVYIKSTPLSAELQTE